MKPEQWTDLLAVNIEAPLRMNETFVELAHEGALGRSPRLIGLASTSGIAGNRGQTNYGAAKAGMIGMTRALAPALAEVGGTANAVAPGFIETDMTAVLADDVIARYQASIPAGRLGRTDEVAAAVSFLASEQAGYISGAVIPVDGGLGMGH